MSNKLYDRLKDISLIVIPAIATLLLTITQIWDLSYGEEIAATITAVGVFLGAVLKISSINYAKNKEVINIEEKEVMEVTEEILKQSDMENEQVEYVEEKEDK